MPIAVGRSVCIGGVVARPELNGNLGTVESNDPSRGRCNVRVDGELMSLRLACLTPEDMPPWDRCRHQLGPQASPAVMQTVNAFIEAAYQITAPCLEHVRLFEPLVRGLTSLIPLINVLASMGIDAYVGSDHTNCRGFAVSVIVLDAVRQVGADHLFVQIAAGARSRSAVVEQLVARLAKCTSATGLFDVLGLFATCQCLQIARARGVGLKQADIDPTPSAVDTIWEAPELPTADPSASVLAPSESACVAGEHIGLLALALVDHACTEALRARSLALRQAVAGVLEPHGIHATVALHRAAEFFGGLLGDDAAVPSPSGAGRATIRENELVVMQATAVAGMAFVEGGGVARVEASLALGLVTLQRQRRDGGRPTKDEKLMAALEAITSLGSPSLATALLEGRAARLVCQLADRGDSVVAHGCMRALRSILQHASPSEFSAALGMAALRAVVGVAANFLYDTLIEDAGRGAARAPPSNALVLPSGVDT